MMIIVGLEMKLVWITVMSLNLNPPSLVTCRLAIILSSFLRHLLPLLLSLASLYPRHFLLQFGLSARLRFVFLAKYQASGLVIADTGATDYMLPGIMAFISYKRVTDLSVCMGNNSFVLVLGQGTAVFSLNGRQVLVCKVLHVPGLAVPLYSLWAHLHQHGHGFLGTFEDDFHVYFPSFVLLVDMSSDCCLTYKSLGHLESL